MVEMLQVLQSWSELVYGHSLSNDHEGVYMNRAYKPLYINVGSTSFIYMGDMLLTNDDFYAQIKGVINDKWAFSDLLFDRGAGLH